MQLFQDEQNISIGAIVAGKSFTMPTFPGGPSQPMLGWGLLPLDSPGSILTIQPTDPTGHGGTTGVGFSWQTVSGPVATPSTTYTATNANHTILATVASGWTLTLPLAASVAAGFELLVKKIDSASATLTIAAAGSDKIDGAATNTSISAQYYYVRLISDGSANWYVTGSGTT